MTDLWRDMDFALPAGHPSTFEAECKQLRAENERLRATLEHMGAAVERMEKAEARVAELEAALSVYADGCDATDKHPCTYEGNLCCMTARTALKVGDT